MVTIERLTKDILEKPQGGLHQPPPPPVPARVKHLPELVSAFKRPD